MGGGGLQIHWQRMRNGDTVPYAVLLNDKRGSVGQSAKILNGIGVNGVLLYLVLCNIFYVAIEYVQL